MHAEEVLRGRTVVVLPDGDEDGQRYAAAVANSLSGHAALLQD